LKHHHQTLGSNTVDSHRQSTEILSKAGTQVKE